MSNVNQVDQLEREIARQVKRANEIAKLAAKKEATAATLQAQALVRKQAKEHVQAMLNNPELKHQTQLQAPQVKLQSEQLLKQVADSIAESKAQPASLKADNVLPDTPVMESLPDTPKLSADEQYRNTLLTLMRDRITQRQGK